MSKNIEYSYKLSHAYEGSFVPFALAVWLMSGVFRGYETEAKDGKGIAMLTQTGDTWLLNAIHQSNTYKETLRHKEALAETGDTDDVSFIQFLGSQFLNEVGGLIGLDRLRSKYIAEEKAELTTAFIQANRGEKDTAADTGGIPDALKAMLDKLQGDHPNLQVEVVNATVNKDGEVEFEGGSLPKSTNPKVELVRKLIEQIRVMQDLRKQAEQLAK